MNIFDRTESFLPKLELDAGVELSESSIEVSLEGIRVGEVDGVSLVDIFGNVGKMETEGLAEAAEFDLASVLQAKLECLGSDLLKLNSVP